MLKMFLKNVYQSNPERGESIWNHVIWYGMADLTSVARTFFWKITETFPNYGITDFSRQITEVTTFLAQNYGKITKI